MAKTFLILHFHAEEPFGPVLEAARASSRDEAIRGSPAFPGADACRVFPALLRLVNSLGVPVLLSLSNERLVRALSDPTEHKALSDGISRGRFLPTPAPAFGADLRLLAPLEVADEVRLNLDLWRMAMITPSFAAQAKTDQRVVLHEADPARALALLRPAPGKDALLLGIDLGSVVRSGDVDAALARLSEALAKRGDCKLATPAPTPHGWAERMLQNILSSGTGYPSFAPAHGDGYAAGRDGFPLELARLAAPVASSARTLARHGGAIVEAGFDCAKLDPKVARGLLLRCLARAGAPDGIPHLERVRASFQLAAILLEALLADPAALEGTAPAAAFDQCAAVPACVERALERARAAGEDAVSAPTLAEAVKLKNKLSRLLPQQDHGAAALDRAAFTAALQKLTVAALAVVEKLAEPLHVGCGS